MNDYELQIDGNRLEIQINNLQIIQQKAKNDVEMLEKLLKEIQQNWDSKEKDYDSIIEELRKQIEELKEKYIPMLAEYSEIITVFHN